MLSRRSLFEKILATRDAHALLMNSLAVGEADSAVDLDRFAQRMGDPALEKKVLRHHADERKHARLLAARLEELGFEREPLPTELDYETYATRFGLGIPRARLDDAAALDWRERARFFAGCKAGEERACAELDGLIDALAPDAETVGVLREIRADEEHHVAYATAELQRMGREDYAAVSAELRAAYRAEARAHREVSLAFVTRLLGLVGAPGWLRAAARLQIRLACAWRLWVTRLRPGLL